jgi:hypothetical protein
LGGSDAGDHPAGFEYCGRFDRPYRDRLTRLLGLGGSGG